MQLFANKKMVSWNFSLMCLVLSVILNQETLAHDPTLGVEQTEEILLPKITIQIPSHFDQKHDLNNLSDAPRSLNTNEMDKDLNASHVVLFISGEQWQDNVLSSHKFDIIPNQFFRISLLPKKDAIQIDKVEILVLTGSRTLSFPKTSSMDSSLYGYVFEGKENDHWAHIIIKASETIPERIEGVLLTRSNTVEKFTKL